jgi:hypothetical protein
MNIQEDLRALAARGCTAPFDFEAFERRRAVAAVRRRTAVLGAAGSIAALGLVSLVAWVTQSPQQLRMADVTLLAQPAIGADFNAAPALIDLDQFDVTAELEDHIAVLDAELSVARVRAAPADELQRLEATRAQLNESLQRVSYAHSLLSL